MKNKIIVYLMVIVIGILSFNIVSSDDAYLFTNTNDAVLFNISSDGTNYFSNSTRGWDGLVTSPTFSFSSEPTTGMYLMKENTIAWSIGSATDTILNSSGIFISSGKDFCIGGGNCLSTINGGNASWNETYADGKYVNVDGDTMTGNLFMNDANLVFNQTIITDGTYLILNISNPDIFIGTRAGAISTGADRIQIGVLSGYLADGDKLLHIGTQAGRQSDGDNQVAVGYSAGNGLTDGTNTASFGVAAGQKADGHNSVYMGTYSAYDYEGTDSVIIGSYAGYSSATVGGAQATLVGANAGNQQSGVSVTAIGYNSGVQNTGNAGLFLSGLAGYQNTGDDSVGIGYGSLRKNDGDSVLGFGYRAFKENTFSSVIGFGKNVQANGNNQVIFGGDDLSSFVKDAYFGYGTDSLTPEEFMTIHATNGLGVNNGTTLNLVGGTSVSGIAGDVILAFNGTDQIGMVGVGKVPTVALDVEGTINATEVCLNSGTCLSTITGGNLSWNESYANDLYLLKDSNINFNNYNITNIGNIVVGGDASFSDEVSIDKNQDASTDLMISNLNSSNQAEAKVQVVSNSGTLNLDSFSLDYYIPEWAGKSGIITSMDSRGLILSTNETNMIQFDTDNKVTKFNFSMATGKAYATDWCSNTGECLSSLVGGNMSLDDGNEIAWDTSAYIIGKAISMEIGAESEIKLISDSFTFDSSIGGDTSLVIDGNLEAIFGNFTEIEVENLTIKNDLEMGTNDINFDTGGIINFGTSGTKITGTTGLLKLGGADSFNIMDIIYSDALGNGYIGIGDSTPNYPLQVLGGSETTDSVSIYAENNISASGFITRTSVFDTTKLTTDYIKNASYYLDSLGEINHSKFYGFVTWKDGQNKTQEGVMLDKEVDLLRQNNYELIEKNKVLEEKITKLESDNEKIENCTKTSKDFGAYKTCINPIIITG